MPLFVSQGFIFVIIIVFVVVVAAQSGRFRRR
jgi:hypothetical protein